MRTYTTEELRESLLAMSIYMADEVSPSTLRDDYDDSVGAWWLVSSEFMEWCVKHKTTCWYSLRRNDQKLRARKAHPCRKTRKK